MPPVEEARAVARAAADVGVRVTLAVFMRDRNPLVYGDEAALLAALPDAARARGRRGLPRSPCRASRSRSPASRRSRRRSRARPSPCSSAPAARNGARTRCSPRIAERSARDRPARPHASASRRATSAPSPTAPIRKAIVERLNALGLLSPRLTLAHCVYARDAELDAIAAAGAVIATNPSSNLHLASGHRADRRGDPARLPRRARRRRLRPRRGRRHRARNAARPFPARRLGLRDAHRARRMARENRRRRALRQRRAGRRARSTVGAPADILVLDLDRLDRDAVMPVEPVDLVFARATAAHVDRLIVAGRDVVRDGRLAGVDLDAAEARRCAQAYRDADRARRAARVSRRLGRRSSAARVAAHYRAAALRLSADVARPESVPCTR